MLRFLSTMLIWLLLALPLRAGSAQEAWKLADALLWSDIIQMLRQEGISTGLELPETMFPGRTAPNWKQTLTEIYDEEWMTETSRAAFADALEDVDLVPALAFFQSDLGRRITALELSARLALLDSGVEDASKERLEQMRADNDPRVGLLANFIAANDLLDSNVVGALNSNFAFYTGLSDGGAFPSPLSQDQMLSEVWSQESTIRDDVEEWLFSFLSLAYQPLSDADLQAYIDISKTPNGQALNNALFVAFDGMFEQISRALGLAVAQVMVAQDL
ncbi:MAG: DUF2059 domain-containing protein [Marinosulfonomonas sp.]|nr:DUF2059 domain-containing protein [Marinosulfonomonas sp.]